MAASASGRAAASIVRACREFRREEDSGQQAGEEEVMEPPVLDYSPYSARPTHTPFAAMSSLAIGFTACFMGISCPGQSWRVRAKKRVAPADARDCGNCNRPLVLACNRKPDSRIGHGDFDIERHHLIDRHPVDVNCQTELADAAGGRGGSLLGRQLFQQGALRLCRRRWLVGRRS